MTARAQQDCIDVLADVTGPHALADLIVAEVRKTLLNTLACAVGATAAKPMDAAIAASAHGNCAVAGATMSATLQRSALLNGMLAHYDDFDDTHAEYRVHGGATVVGAALALGSARSIPGDQLVRGVAAGMEFQYRVASRMMPEHHRRGWHPTGAIGVLGAAVTSAVLEGCDLEQTVRAIEIACGMTVGVREVFGTEAKPFHAGKAASNGVRAARLAIAGRVGGDDCLTNYLQALAGQSSLDGLTPRVVSEWEFLRNTYKPYPCGRVIHPIIDAGIDLRGLVGSDKVELFEVRCHPTVLDVTGIMRPRTPLEAKFSAAFGFATGYLRGTARQADFTDDAIRDPNTVALLDKVRIVGDPAIENSASAAATAWLSNGAERTVEVAAASGSLEKPMSYESIYRKAVALTEPVDPSIAPRLRDAIAALPSGATSTELVDACRPLSRQSQQLTPSGTARPSDNMEENELQVGRVTPSVSDAAATFCLTASPPQRVVKTVTLWHSACLQIFDGMARAPASNDADDSAPSTAFLLGSTIGSASPPGVPQLFLPVAAAIWAVRGIDCEPDDMAVALSVGIELGMRLQRAAAGRTRSVDIVGCFGPIAAGAALARRFGCTESATRALLTLTGTQIGGFGCRSGAADLYVAAAAAAAVEAHELVVAGLFPSADIIGGRRGILTVLGAPDSAAADHELRFPPSTGWALRVAAGQPRILDDES